MNRCVIPAISEDVQGDGRWMSQHNQHLADTKDREPDVLWIGDSIMAHLKQRPMWNDLFEPLHSLNFGVSGDTTQNVLWRIKNGALDNIKPKVVIVHVGTNNFGDLPEDISDGIVEIVNVIRERHPDTYIVFVELLPRGQHPNPLRERNSAVNELVRRKLQGQPRVQTVSCEKGLVGTDGTISHHDMPDYLHLSDAGYRKAFEPLHDLLLQLLSEGEEEKDLTPSE
ncbi:platelet-activating factor acetylhydrolase IB subunit beta homolog [Macrosteles quadrilineatus]|uniref:platelet-activating factor acetylhydrolase IB subunit beta homolog n=1 Tax=Macrosteles quadrilineatus TaxID=74068 RepID=UPI0023E0AB31|nr:platelet-activating factor acetylhydrolase IB subunit beta homolog [Macrosteles quadrilineatus]